MLRGTRYTLSTYSNVNSFRYLDRSQIEAHTSFSSRLQLNSQFRWTPLIQVSQESHSLPFTNQMTAYHKQPVFKQSDEDQLTDLLLQEALSGSDYDFYYDYKSVPSAECPFHG